MKKIEYLKHAPGARRGDVRRVDRQSAKVLVDLGYARYYVAPVRKPIKVAVPVKVEVEDRPVKRTYKRRDMKAED